VSKHFPSPCDIPHGWPGSGGTLEMPREKPHVRLFAVGYAAVRLLRLLSATRGPYERCST